MNRLLFVLVVVAMLQTGCASHASRLNGVSVGMTKQDVVNVMGSPTSSSAREGVEYLNYELRVLNLITASTSPYFVRLINGKVDAYGKLGDFDSTKAPEIKNTIDLNIKK